MCSMTDTGQNVCNMEITKFVLTPHALSVHCALRCLWFMVCIWIWLVYEWQRHRPWYMCSVHEQARNKSDLIVRTLFSPASRLTPEIIACIGRMMWLFTIATRQVKISNRLCQACACGHTCVCVCVLTIEFSIPLSFICSTNWMPLISRRYVQHTNEFEFSIQYLNKVSPIQRRIDASNRFPM